ncbi:UNVERIFIED_CONTAM: hypothetical protein Sradi_4143800 [Sesamum radiatum]|uniref:Uncharacterized protein n=1 Tax=Sesamum radiatum TaxID=300843 RepID=A0AAW2P5A5_SESRA
MPSGDFGRVLPAKFFERKDKTVSAPPGIDGRQPLEDHGCMKIELYHLHCTNASEIVKVDANVNPFSEVESYFVDAKLYLVPNNMQEVLPLRFPVGYSSEKVHTKAAVIENNDEKLHKATKDKTPTSGKREVKKPPYSLVFRYVVRLNDKGK